MKMKIPYFSSTKTTDSNLEPLYPVFQSGTLLGDLTQTQIIQLYKSGECQNTMVKVDDVWYAIEKLSWVLENNDIVEQSEAGQVDSPRIDDADYEIDDTFEKDETMVVCPHCWHKFGMSKMLFISQHVDLIGDPVLGPDAQQRFIPSHFNEQGYAIDAKGMVCQDMACPKCHLRIPDATIDMPFSIYSVVGAPASGKSYFLTAMTWQLRNILASHFDYTLTDTDAMFNSVLNNYESILFLNRNNNEYVALPKTELQGHDFSNQIMLNGMSVDLPLPFIFTLTPTPANTLYENTRDGIQNIVLYDNAGEHFEPGRDSVTNIATHHLVHSDGIIFLYDPIKDSRMVTQCDSSDPQVAQINRGVNQLILLNEMINRIKKYRGMKPYEKYDKPLVVVIPKYDAWKKTFPVDLEDTDFVHYDRNNMNYSLDLSIIINVSYIMRSELLRISPEVVATCEAFFSSVYFIPVSALGRMPEYDSAKDMIAVKPQNLKPIWAEVPILLQMWHNGRIGGVCSQMPDPLEVENYKYTADSLIFMIPGTNIRETVPLFYCDRTVYDMKISRFIKMPPLPKKTKVHNEGAMDDFWNA